MHGNEPEALLVVIEIRAFREAHSAYRDGSGTAAYHWTEFHSSAGMASAQGVVAGLTMMGLSI